MNPENNPAPLPWRPHASPWLIAVSVMLATFMEVLDTTIVTVALPHIAGSMAASTDEATWVVTSYLVSNAIVLPATAWFARRFGRKRFLMACIILFTISSFLCGTATSLGFLILTRVVQGAGGGALQPISQAILLESFPPYRRGAGMAAFSVGVIVAPVIGPTLGGWITDNYSWRWLFYINIPVGIAALLLIQRFVEDPPYIRDARPGPMDLIGLGLLTIGIAALQVILDKGQEADWFGAVWIRWFALTSALALVWFVIWELRTPNPVVDLRILKNRNFAVGTLLITLMGALIYSPLTLLPEFLQTILGYPAVDSGLAQSPRGLGALLMTPLVGFLTSRMDARRLIALGFMIAGVSIYMFSNLTLDVGVPNIALANFLQGLGMSMIFVPLSTISSGALPVEQIGSGTGIYNLMRNLGGSIGISMVTTLLVRRAQAHQVTLAAHLTPYDHTYVTGLHTFQGALVSHSGSVQAGHQALGLTYSTLIQQSTLLAYIDDFRWLALVSIVCLGGVFLLKRTPSQRPGPAH
ncbi:Drug resistance transporter, EmrB/QacA subfamily [Verrucomicrobia bacterium]|nr:Drug resistance transporter, EmrB/QacA subfamily [Verrucomicrobiota bacterium]